MKNKFNGGGRRGHEIRETAKKNKRRGRNKSFGRQYSISEVEEINEPQISYEPLNIGVYGPKHWYDAYKPIIDESETDIWYFTKPGDIPNQIDALDVLLVKIIPEDQTKTLIDIVKEEKPYLPIIGLYGKSDNIQPYLAQLKTAYTFSQKDELLETLNHYRKISTN